MCKNARNLTSNMQCVIHVIISIVWGTLNPPLLTVPQWVQRHEGGRELVERKKTCFLIDKLICALQLCLFTCKKTFVTMLERLIYTVGDFSL